MCWLAGSLGKHLHDVDLDARPSHRMPLVAVPPPSILEISF